MGWPTFEDGTVDWVMVFEDADTGLIPLIDRADSREKLESCVHVVVQSLFTRDADAAVRKAYIDALDQAIHSAGDGEDSLTGLKYDIRNLLRTIKTERVQRAHDVAKGLAQRPKSDADRQATAEEALKALDAWMAED